MTGGSGFVAAAPVSTLQTDRQTDTEDNDVPYHNDADR